MIKVRQHIPAFVNDGMGGRVDGVANAQELLNLPWITNKFASRVKRWEYQKPPGRTPEEAQRYEEQGIQRGSGGLLIAHLKGGNYRVVAHLQFPTWEHAFDFKL